MVSFPVAVSLFKTKSNTSCSPFLGEQQRGRDDAAVVEVVGRGRAVRQVFL